MIVGTIEPFEHEGSILFTSHKRDLGGRVLAEWFGNDLVSKTELSRIIHTINEASKSPANAGWVWGGNAHSVFVAGDMIYIENQYAEADKIFMTKAQLLHALERFRTFFAGERRDENFAPEIFEVEFEAEGEHAEEKYQSLING